jgi:hypothetical protein
MKKLLIMALVSTNAMALDFDKEWAKFDTDFAKMKSQKVAIAKIDTPSITKLPEVVERSLPATNTAPNVIERVDPKSPDRLGLKLENPAMRDKLEKLYNKPDTVVYSLTLE